MQLRTIPAAALVGLLALGGCSSSDSGSDTGEAAPAPDTVQRDEGASAQFDVAEQREVVYTATLHALDDDPIAVADAVWAAAESFEAIVTGDSRSESGDRARAELTVRVPSAHVADAMEAFAALADEETGRTVDIEDVTGEAVDLAASVATAAASLERVRDLLEQADSVPQILELETELTEREAALAGLEAQLSALDERVAMSTITFSVTAPRAASEAPGGPGTFAEGLGAGWSSLLGLLRGGAVVVGVLLPFVPAVAVVLAAVLVPLRRRRRRLAS